MRNCAVILCLAAVLIAALMPTVAVVAVPFVVVALLATVTVIALRHQRVIDVVAPPALVSLVRTRHLARAAIIG